MKQTIISVTHPQVTHHLTSSLRAVAILQDGGLYQALRARPLKHFRLCHTKPYGGKAPSCKMAAKASCVMAHGYS